MVEPISSTATVLLETAPAEIMRSAVQDSMKRRLKILALAMFSLLGAFLCAGVVSPCPAQSASPEDTQKWATRLTESSRELIADERVGKIMHSFFRSMASYTLALAGHTEGALAFARDCPDEEERLDVISSVADAQSNNGDVAGALLTADSLPEGRMRQRTLGLIAIRQAQTGNFDEAITLLERVSDARHRNLAVGTIVAAMLKAHAYQQAADLYARTEDDKTREQLRYSMKRHRTEPTPGDPDFTQRTVEQFKQGWGYTGLSEEDIEFVRLKCHARIAIYQEDDAAFVLAMDEASRTIENWDRAMRRSALLSLGMIYHESGDRAAAREVFRKVLESSLRKSDGEDEPWIDLVRMWLSTGTVLETVVDVMSDDELQLHAAKMVDTPDAADLLGGFAGAMIAHGKHELVERLVETLKTPEQRFHVARGALDACSRLRRADDRADSGGTHESATATDRDEDDKGRAEIDRIIELSSPARPMKRPRRDFMGLYNVPRPPYPEYDGEIWQNEESLPELSVEEFWGIRMAVVETLRRHGRVYGEPDFDGEYDFFVYEDKFSDRTQKVELNPSERLPNRLAPAVEDLQRLLARHPLWRVMFPGDGKKKQAREQFFVVYPDAVRIRQASKRKSIADAITENARLRVRQAAEAKSQLETPSP